MSLTGIWEKAQNEIKEKVGEISYETWFSTIQVIEKDQGTLVIESPDDFFKNWIIDHYQEFIQETLNNHSQNSVQVEYSVNSQIIKQDAPGQANEAEKGLILPAVQGYKSTLNSHFTFDNFALFPKYRLDS